ncbi:MAG TPA: SpoIID/LytB domain-containing protein [Solirubrobacterales bacterium]|nr:SpoIID/LytB domain-containing protein [Solirubrobacterales bacterium]HNA24944.1 SpoIID/LytB domain-containing protein [Solirubrobacterales bacterium]HNA45027.1 SpoIID/LytB domain-containing protein [Solirubrobacterales bacterium]HNI40725.1 SpoIID/LytB domain-containing protein [Solirubrobacterales bacterium]HNK36093.1 SpoIID/LytB domain-containing protein [Solirubrobacterales bacterium]
MTPSLYETSNLLPRSRFLLLALTVAALLLPSAASPGQSQAATWTVRGGGFGHGLGMSAYGAYGMGLDGYRYGQILRHYYRGIRIRKLRAKRNIKVLLDVDATPYFSGARWACGRKLKPRLTYGAALGRNGIFLRGAGGKPLKKCGGRLRTEASGNVVFKGLGAYRGGVEIVRGGGSLYLINNVPLNKYCRGVLAGEVIPSWPLETLKAFALAARSIGLSSKGTHDGFDVYPDTRSQVYGGISTEYPRTNRACAKTPSQALFYGGKVAMALFSASSGGHTESIQNMWGGAAIPYLQGVADPWDKVSPYYRWTYSFSPARMNSLLGSYLAGRLRSVKITQTGVSKRVMWARLYGTRGVTKIRGDSLQYALGLPDRLIFSIRKK